MCDLEIQLANRIEETEEIKYGEITFVRIQVEVCV